MSKTHWVFQVSETRLFLAIGVPERDRPARTGDVFLTDTGSKLFYRGGGWWAEHGYREDGSDLHRGKIRGCRVAKSK